jgi:biotin synthase
MTGWDEIQRLVERVLGGGELTGDEALRLAEGDSPLEELAAGALMLREAYAGRTVEFCSIVNARSGRCPNDCTFCAQSAGYETGAPVHGLLDAGEIVAAARDAAACGASRFSVVTSGRALGDADFERACEAVAAVAALGTVGACASLGLLTAERARRLKAAGLTRYHHNLETSERFYPQVCTTQPYAAKLETLRAARASGLEVCSGGIFGLGESWADRIDIAMALRGLNVASVPVNFLVPIAGTPLEAEPMLPAEEALRIIAVLRFLLPRTSVRICGGREAVLGERQDEIFSTGADAAMIGNYLTTLGRPPEDDLAMADALGLTVRMHDTATERARG